MKLDWKRLLELNQREVLGLDIGSSAVKIVQLRKDSGGWTVTAAGIAEIADATKDKDDQEITNTVSAISECLQSTEIQTRLAVCSVCGPEVAVRHFKFPALLVEEIEGAVLLEAEQVCPFNVSDGGVDYQAMPEEENNAVRGVLVAAANKLIKRKRKLVKEAAVEPVLMDVDGLALLNCFSEYEKVDPGQTIAILNVGSSFTNLAIMGDNELPFVRDIAYAGKDIIKEIASENEVTTQTVRNIIFGKGDLAQPELGLSGSLERVCRKLITDVTETLRYYLSQNQSASIDKIYVCGGFALVEGFVEILDNQLPATAVLWNPFDKIACAANVGCEDILEKSGSALAVAAGLAMRTI